MHTALTRSQGRPHASGSIYLRQSAYLYLQNCRRDQVTQTAAQTPPRAQVCFQSAAARPPRYLLSKRDVHTVLVPVHAFGAATICHRPRSVQSMPRYQLQTFPTAIQRPWRPVVFVYRLRLLQKRQRCCP